MSEPAPPEPSEPAVAAGDGVAAAAVPALPPGPDAVPPPRHRALLFVAIVLPAYALLGGAAQVASPFLGLVASQLALLALPAAVAALGCGYRARDALLLSRRPPARAIVLGVAIGAAAFFAAGALMSLGSLALPERWVEGFDLPRKILELPRFQRLGVWVTAATVAPLCEELCFRGWILGALRTRHRTGTALALSGLLFAVVHLDPVRFAAVLALGVLYAWLAWRSGSLWPGVAAHVTNNAIGAALAAGGTEGDLAVAHAHPLQVATSSAVMLVLAAAVVRALAVAYRRGTPEPPPITAVLVPRDGAAPPSRFRPGRVPRGWRLALVGGVALLWALAWRGATRAGGTRAASDSAPPGTVGSPGDRAAGAAPPPAAGPRAP